MTPPGRWQALTILAVAMLLGMTPWLSATAVVPALREAWSLTAGESAGLTIAVQLGFVAGALASAALNLADRYSPRHLMAFGAAGAAAINLGLLAVHGLGPALVVRAATGVCLALVYPPAMKAMAGWFDRDRGTALGVMVGALTLGSAMPHLVDGFGGLAWQPVIVATSAMAGASTLLVLVFARDGPLVFPSAAFDPRQAWRALAHRPVRLASLGYFGHMWELYAMWAWFGVFFQQALTREDIAHASAWSALAAFCCIGIGALGCLAAGRFADVLGRARTTAVALAVSGSCALGIGWLQTAGWPVLLAIGLVWGTAVVADSAQFSTLVTELGDQAYVGSALTLQLALGFALTVPTIWLIPLAAMRLGWGPAFGLLAAGPLVGLWAMARLAPIEAAYRAGRLRSPG